MSNANNPQLEKLKLEYQEVLLNETVPLYLQQEVALFFFLLGKEKNTFYWGKEGNLFVLKAEGDEVLELYLLAKLLGIKIQTDHGDTDNIFTVYYAKINYSLHTKVTDLLTEMINTAFPEEPIQHPRDLEHHDGF